MSCNKPGGQKVVFTPLESEVEGSIPGVLSFLFGVPFSFLFFFLLGTVCVFTTEHFYCCLLLLSTAVYCCLLLSTAVYDPVYYNYTVRCIIYFEVYLACIYTYRVLMLLCVAILLLLQLAAAVRHRVPDGKIVAVVHLI